MHFDTLAIRATHPPNPAPGIALPLPPSTTVERGSPAGSFDSPPDNATRDALEHALARLEGGAVGMVFGSGLAATATLLQTLRPGDHVLLPTEAPFRTLALLEQVFHPWGLTYTRVDLTDLNAVQQSLHENTRLVWCETPSSSTLALTDLLLVSQLAHEAGAICVCDNTWATPVLQRPLDLNCDVVVHSTAQHLGGDGLGGALVFKYNNELARRVRALQHLSGAVPSPFDCYLTSRGLPTLGVRVRAQTATAQAVAEFLDGHPALEQVHYPGLLSHPGRVLMHQQMNGPGTVLSVQVKGGADDARRVVSKLKLFAGTTSLGGVESLVELQPGGKEPNASMPPNLLRLSIGLEHAEDLIGDLARALA